MVELKTAETNMYGYRFTGPNEPMTRVRVFAGQTIPPDLVDLEDAPELADELAGAYPELTAASMSAESQAAAQEERNAASVAGTSVESTPDPDAAVSRPTARESQIRSGAIPDPDAEKPKGKAAKK